jgi:hypothetical protein
MTVRELGEKWSGGMQSVVESLARGRLEEVEREGERVDEGVRGELSAAAAAAGKGAKEGGKRYVSLFVLKKLGACWRGRG